MIALQTTDYIQTLALRAGPEMVRRAVVRSGRKAVRFRRMDHNKEFIKVFNALSYGHSKGKLFSDFAEIASNTAHQQPYHAGMLPKDAEYERIEQAYLATVKHYKKEELDRIAELYGIATLALLDEYEDFLGPVYMLLEISNDRSGQFFTPVSVSRMMAKMTMQEAGEKIKENGYVTVSDPAAGAAGMLIEAAREIREQGHDPRCTMWFQAIDIDRTCFNMAYFQLATLGLTGDVVHGNTLSMESWETRATPSWRMMQAARGISAPAQVTPSKMSLDDVRQRAAEREKPVKQQKRQLTLDL